MKVLYGARVVVLVVLGWFACMRAEAQNFGIGVTNSPDPVQVSNTLTFSIVVTNLTGLSGVNITNFMPSPFTFVSETNNLGGPVSNSPGIVVIQFGQLQLGQVVVVTLAVQPTSPGQFTNFITAALLGSTNATTATNVTTVAGGGGGGGGTADLGVTISGPAQAVLANDWMTYGVAVTNLGSNNVNNVLLSNNIPAGVGLIGVSPTNLPFVLTNSAVLFNLGALRGGGGTNVFLTVQPTNAGILALTASVGAQGLNNTNATSSAATNNVTVGTFVTNQLTASNLTAQTYNPQTGLMEQTVQLSNVSTTAVTAARVIVSGLTNVLYNAVGTNNGNPFVENDSALDPGNSVNLTLEYFVPTRLPVSVPDSAYTAVPVSSINLSPPAGTNFAITLMTNLPSGSVLIEFQSIPGRSYTILYSDNPAMTNAVAAQPAIVAPADRTQWIDDGPPKTVAAPTNVSARFYSVQLNQ